MKSFFCEYFTWEIDEEIDLSWEGENPTTLHLSNAHGIEGILTLRVGKFADINLIESQITRFVARYGGYLEPMDEEFPDEFVYVIEDKTRRENRHHFVRWGNAYSLNLIIRGDIQDRDVLTYRELLRRIVMHESQIPDIDDVNIALPIEERTHTAFLGQRRFLESEYING